jgi:hypothetical protein
MPIQSFKNLGFKKSEVNQLAPVEISSPDSLNDGINRPEELKEIVGKINEKKSNVPFNLKIIPRNKIIFNDKNDYEQVDIERLAEGILHFGLIHNLEGYYDEDQDLYVIESGERRTRAIDFLLNKYSNFEDKDSQEYKDFLDNVKGYESGYPINVKRKRYTEEGALSQLDEIDSEIRLMDANEEVRPTNPQDKYKRVRRRAELLEKRNALLPYKERINVNKEIGDKLGMTERQVQKYKNIDLLIPELKEEFLRNNISLADGANYSSLTEEEQQNILRLIQEGKKVSADDIKKLKHEKDAAQTELIQKERELSTLKEESDQLQEKHEKELVKLQESIKQDRERIKKEISDEILNNSPDRKKVKELEKELKDKEVAQREIDNDLLKTRSDLNNKNIEIKRLETELKQMKSQPGQDLERIRIEVKLSTAIESTIGSVSDIKKTLTAYSKLSGSDRSKFLEEIETIVNNLNSILHE